MTRAMHQSGWARFALSFTFFLDKICFVFRIFAGIWRNTGVSLLKKIFPTLCALAAILKKIWFCGSLALIVLWMSVIEVFDLILWCNQLLQGVIIISSVKKVFLLDKQVEICEKYIMFWERSWCFPRVNLCILDVNFKFFHKIGVDHVKFSLI